MNDMSLKKIAPDGEEWPDEYELPDDWDDERSCDPDWDRFDVDWDGDAGEEASFLFEDDGDSAPVDVRWARAR